MNFLKALFDLLIKKEVYGTLLVIAISYLIYRLLKKIVSRILISGKTSLEKKRRMTLIVLLENIVRYIIVIIAGLLLLELYGIDTKSFIAGLGIVGVILGLALQDTVKDFIAGFSIIMENYFIVGDYVTYNGFTGKIISLGLKTTKIKSFNGEVYTVANRNIDAIVNLSQKSTHIYIEVPTAYEESLKKVEKALNKVIETAIKETDADSQSKYLGIKELSDSSIKYLIDIHCPQEHQWQTKREVLKIIKEQYEKDNIKIPYNQLEVHNGDKI